MTAAFCLTVDFDAVSLWLHAPGWDGPRNRSRGRFGAEVGAPRLLDLLDDRDVPSTWFVPGHTVESFPDACEAVVAAGHEVAHHGWSHVSPAAFDSRQAERADLERGIESLRSLTGRRPAGYRSPSWDLSEHTLGLLDELGFSWDSSGMAREFQPYYARAGERAPADDRYDPGTPTDLVEVPVSWTRDDFPLLAHAPDHRPTGDERAVFAGWRSGFDWLREHGAGADARDTPTEWRYDGVYVLTVHPQVIGHGRRLGSLADLLDHVRSRDDATFETVGGVVEAFRDARGGTAGHTSDV